MHRLHPKMRLLALLVTYPGTNLRLMKNCLASKPILTRMLIQPDSIDQDQISERGNARHNALLMRSSGYVLLSIFRYAISTGPEQTTTTNPHVLEERGHIVEEAESNEEEKSVFHFMFLFEAVLITCL